MRYRHGVIPVRLQHRSKNHPVLTDELLRTMEGRPYREAKRLLRVFRHKAAMRRKMAL